MSVQSIDYGSLVSQALRGVARQVIEELAEHGSLPGDHHLYVTFSTSAPGVVLPVTLKEQYPDEMTIVLQHQFRDLDVDDDGFSITLTFSSVERRLSIPFESIVGFADPAASFAIRFGAEPDPEPDLADDRPPGEVVPFPSR